MPPSDRWGAFQLDGDYAVGVSAGDAYFGVACQTGGGLYFEYNSGRALHADVASEEMSWLVLLTNTNTQAANVPTTLVHTVSDPAVVANWIDLVAKANSVKIGLSPDPRLREFVLVNASDFSARGSSSALKELREKCAPV